VKALVERLSRALVETPSAVNVDEYEDQDGIVVYEVQVAPEDRGRVIGRRGQTADALRTLVEALGRRKGYRCDVEIVD
jgi:predicted RNA-binding protein YlqC (UPF0109 family)